MLLGLGTLLALCPPSLFPQVHRLNKGRGCVGREEVSVCTYLETEVKKGKKMENFQFSALRGYKY